MDYYWYNRRTKGYFVENLHHNFGEYHKDYTRVGLAIHKSVPEFRYRCKRKIKRGILLKDYSRQFIIWRKDLQKWTVSDLPF